MELIRGKTFIKSYGQTPPEKTSSAGGKEKKNVPAERAVNECDIKKNVLNTHKKPKAASVNEGNDNVGFPKFVRKSKTHDCVTRENEDVKHRLPNSNSFSGGENNLNSSVIKINTNINSQSSSSQNMIDYRNFVPQMPFVPSVAKSLPRKRISLKRSKNGLKSIFQLKKNKQQSLVTLAEDDRLHPTVFEMDEGKGTDKRLRNNRDMYSNEFISHEFPDNELYVDTMEYCRTVCEDVASLKSFDSLTGCGEIYADESSADIENCKDGQKIKYNTKEIPIGKSFQGGVEQLASPAKSEAIDFSRLCGRVNNPPARSFCSNLAFDSTFSRTSNEAKEINQDLSKDNSSNFSNNDFVSSNENFTDAGSPVSTSDEGYYDSYSPGMDDDKKEVEIPQSFPRDSYSGDALFELFCDPNEPKASPVPDCDMSISGQSTDVPMSIYSFCVGSEETMASQPAEDLVGDSILHSSWKGRECLLKLCDTELTLTMGLVNWLKKTGKNIEFKDTDTNSLCSSEQCQQKELSDESRVADNNNKTKSMYNGTMEETEKIVMKAENFVNNSKASHGTDFEDLQVNTASTIQMEKPLIHMVEYKSCLPGKETIFETDSVDNNHESLLMTTQNCNQETHELISPYINNLAHLDTMHILSSADGHSQFNDDSQKPLHSLSLTCVRSCLSPVINENDKSLEQCATQVASLQITYMDQSKDQENNMNEKLLKSYEMSQNCKNETSFQEYVSQQCKLYRVLSDTNKHETNMKNLKMLPWKESTTLNKICELTKYKESSAYDHNAEEECTLIMESNQQSKTTNITNFAKRPNFLPLFSSQCSSIISSCSSTMYKMRNSGKTVFFFNSPNKPNKIFGNTEEVTQNSNIPPHDVSATDLSINTVKEFKATIPTDHVM